VVPEAVRHFIGGKHVFSTLRKSYGVTDPATGKEYAQVEVGLGADVNQAVLAARGALEAGPWSEMAAQERARVLSGIADAIDARADDIAAAQALGPGLPVTQAREQAARASALFRLVADLAAKAAETAQQATDSGPGQPGQPGYLVARPAGVAGLVTSWRTPFLAQARAVAPALAAGCTVVLKPHEWAPLPAALLADVTTAAGLPVGVLNIVHGSLHRKALGAQARDALVAHPAVDRLSLADEADGAPGLIFADADLDQAADSALFGAFALNGQRRTATSTILVQRPVYDTLVSRLAQRAERISVGDPSDPSTQVGPLPHADAYDKLSSLVRLGIREGARLAAGGRRPAGRTEGHFLAATVLADVDPSMPIFAGPACGPLIRVTPFDTDEEAISLAGAAGQTAAYMWTADLARAHRLALAMAAASIWVNSHNRLDLLHATAGQPAAEAGPADIDFYTQSRTVLIAADEAPVPQFGA